MIRRALAAGAVLLALSACQVESAEPAPAAGAANSLDRVADSETSAAGSRPSPAPSSEPSRGGEPFAVRSDRNLTDMITGCPHQNPLRRPRGSNCFGIFPEQCGADQAQPFHGQPLTQETRARIEAIAPPDGVRFIRPGEPVIQDLRAGRLNIELDAEDRVERIDCY